jgi:O-antigen/teichoic acid export membrane protein
MVQQIKRKIENMRTDGNLHQLLKGSGWVMFFKVLGALSGYLFTFVVSKELGAGTYGIFEMCFTAMMIITTLGKFGMDSALVRLIPQYKEHNKRGAIPKVYRNSLWFGTAMGAVLGIMLFFSAGWLARVFGTEEYEWGFKITALIAIPSVWWFINMEAIRAFKRMLPYAVMQQGAMFLLATLLIWAIPWNNLADSFQIPVVTFYIAILVFSGISFLVLKPSLDKEKLEDGTPDSMRFLLRLATPILVSGSMFLVMSWTDTIMLGYFADEVAIGVYRVIFKIASLITFTQFAINSIAGPMYAQFHARNSVKDMAQITRQIGMLNLVFAIPLFAAIALFPEFITGMFGEEYKVGAMEMIVLAAGQLVNSLCGPNMTILTMTGKERNAQSIMMVAAGANVVLNFTLIPNYGIMGAAIATSVSMAIWNIASVAAIYRHFKIITFPILGYFQRRSW